MDRMLVVVFDNESKAYEGKKALMQLDIDGSISVYGHAVVVKNADGTTTVRESDDRGPLGTLVGTTLGSLIGLLGGPVWPSAPPWGFWAAARWTWTKPGLARTSLMT